jgi:hypothetical protein
MQRIQRHFAAKVSSLHIATVNVKWDTIRSNNL